MEHYQSYARGYLTGSDPLRSGGSLVFHVKFCWGRFGSAEAALLVWAMRLYYQARSQFRC